MSPWVQFERGQRQDQRRIPELSRLYSDYLYRFDSLERFYPGGRPFDLDLLAGHARKLSYPDDRRASLAGLLERQNRSWAPGGQLGSAAATHLCHFAEPGTIAIVTGQQVGLLGGPLLAVHKAMTAVLLAERLQERGVKAVPIFWMATQDHDLAEVDHAWVLDDNAAPVKLSLQVDAAADAPVGDLRLGEAVGDVLESLARCTGASGLALEDLTASYRPEASLGSAFAALFARWFAPWGLLLFDPLDAPEAAALWKPYYRWVLERHSELAQLLEARAAELIAAGYHVQVEQTAAATMLFLHRDGARLGLRCFDRDGRKQYLLGEEPLQEADVLRWIEERPDAVSPSALLRPLLQNVALPAVAQIVGPSETAYLAQTDVLYPACRACQPIAWPRASVSLLDARAQRLLNKYDLRLEQLWHEPADELLARRALPSGIEPQMKAISDGFDRGFAALEGDLERLDATLVDATRNALQKIRHQMDQLELRVVRGFARRSQELSAQAQHLAGTLTPQRTLQERVLAAAGWVIRYPDLLHCLHQQLDPLVADHQVLAL